MERTERKNKVKVKRIFALILVLVLMITSVTVYASDEEQQTEPPVYKLFLNQSEYGNITVGNSLKEVGENEFEVLAGTKISILVQPEKEYELNALQMNGTDLELELNESMIAFTMPEYDVTLSSTFHKKEIVEEKSDDINNQDDKTDIDGKALKEIEEESEKSLEDTDPEIMVDEKLLCDDPNCLRDHVGKTLDPALYPVASIPKINAFMRSAFRMNAYRRSMLVLDNPTIGQQVTGVAAIQFDGADWSTPGTFTLSFLDGELEGHVYSGANCLNHGAANPGDLNTPQGDYVATIVDIDTAGGSITWSIVVTPPGACAEGTTAGYQRVGGLFSTPYSFMGTAELQKTSSNPELTNGNDSYSLAGAEYGIYSQDGTLVTTMITNENGLARVDIQEGNYVVKEITPPKGFALDTNEYPITVTSGETAVLNVTDIPQSDPVSIILGKIDKNTNTNKPQGSASLKDAQFTIKYYKGFYTTDPAIQGFAAERTWVMKTDERGFTRLGDKYKVSGDAFYYMTTGDVTIPLGTITIQESKAPQGYLVNPEVFIRQIKSEGTAEMVETYNEPIIPETIIKGGVRIEKWDNELNSKMPQGGATLAKAEFDIISLNDNEVVVGGKTYKKNKVITTLVTDSKGVATTSNNYLPYGSYRVKERKPPAGYMNTGVIQRDFKITKNNVIVNLNTASTAIKNNVARGGVLIEKWDSETGKKPQGNAQLSGAEINLISLNENPVIVEGRTYKKNAVITKLVTNTAGLASTANNYLPYGRYRLQEVKPPTGYTGEGIVTRDFSITENLKMVNLNTADTAIKNNIIRGGVLIEKWDSETGKKPQGEGKLSGAEINLITLNDKAVVVDGKTFNKNDVITTLVTDASGVAQTANKYLPTGRYRLQEVKPPTGYTGDGILTREFTIKEHGKIVKLNTADTAIKNEVIRGDLQLVKFKESADAEEEIKTPLEGIIFRITSKTIKDLQYEIITDKNGYASTTQLGLGTKGNLPYGTYIVKEMNPPAGTKPVKDFEIVIQASGETLYYILEDKLIVSPVRLLKVDATTGNRIPIANAEFQLLDKDKNPITMTTHYPNTVVHHTFKTDGSGSFTLPEKLSSGVYYWRELNAPDGYLKGTDLKFEITKGHEWADPFIVKYEDNPAMGKVTIRKTDKVTGNVLQGAEFEVRAKEDIITPDGTIRVKKGELVETLITGQNGTATSKKLFLGKYKIKETKQVPGYILDKKTYDFELKYKDQVTEIVKEIVEITNKPTKIIVDKKVTGGKEKLAGVEFEVWNKAMMEDEELPDFGIKETFKTDETGQIVLERLVPGTYCIQEVKGIPGYVLDKTIFEIIVGEDGRINEQDVGILEVENARTELIGTTAIDKDTGTHEAIPQKTTTFVDRVEFKNLQIGEKYTVKGILMKKATGEPLVIDGKKVTAEKTFVAETSDGIIDVEFVFDASSLKGVEIVVFEKVYLMDIEIAAHEDLEDKDQTIKFPDSKIGTTARDKETGTNEAIPKKGTTFIDTVTYKNLIANQEYTVKGVLMNQSTGEPLLIDGKKVTAEKTFRPKEKNGKVDLAFTFDARDLKGQSIVVFEKLYADETEVAAHEDMNDKGQTIEFPDSQIRTSAKDKDSGTQEAIAKKNVTVIDAVKYENLIIGKEYTVKGILMKKASAEPLLIDGKKVTAEKTFKPAEKNGTVELEFTFDASSLNNQEIVVFEKLYADGIEVAVHEDIHDKNQTVKIKIGKLTTKMPGNKGNGKKIVRTGDMESILPYLLLLAFTGSVMGVSVYRRKKKENENEE